MSKSRIILAALGGGIAVVAAVLAAFVYFSYSAKVAAVEGDEETDGLETVVSKVQKHSRAEIYPSAKSVKELDENAEKVAEWLKSVRMHAASGDRAFPKTTPAAFKTFVVNDAKRLASLPGGVEGVIARADFAFGPFKNYITGGEMPSEAQLKDLQRAWDDIATVMETLSGCGVSEVLDVQNKAEDKKTEAEEEDSKSKRKARRQQRKKGKAAAAADAAKTSLSSARSYVFVFSARAQAIVKAVNAFATCERFITVDDLTFRRAGDVVAAALAGEDKKADGASNRGRRRRRGGDAAQDRAADAPAPAADGVVTDPVRDAPMNVTMTLTVHDFGSLNDTEKSEEGQE